jgi:hypothetical protein
MGTVNDFLAHRVMRAQTRVQDLLRLDDDTDAWEVICGEDLEDLRLVALELLLMVRQALESAAESIIRIQNPRKLECYEGRWVFDHTPSEIAKQRRPVHPRSEED